ncbi:hypothetical protein [Dubosiella newyorkensis]|uniref:hypothetical protein n=1 Tax=Dubosiella newyorkensis TaxID=1862672 RepID=UPI002587078C|nr:hypothetical protein [Dubosiella newyorkensis]
MSNYPVLPIVTTPEGFEYAEGHNLLTKISDEWWIPGEGTNKTISRKTLFLKDYEFNEYKALSLQIEFEVEGATKGTIYLQSPSNGVWNSNDAKWFPPITQNAMSSSMSLASLNGKITKIVKENYRLSADWLERAYANGQRGEMCLNFRVDNTNPETKIRFRNVMLEYGPKAHPYRPNPADLVGGGGCL